ncbi:MAG: hypothetical protein IT369_03590, partial [Candidatus Latescibacteria bacterium]|nr:hypothetical protein [Candidatus Latescibacterota bacterium]
MSSSTPLEVGLRRLRRVYWWSLGLALGLHLILLLPLVIGSSPRDESIPEPAKVKFFTRRDPTLTKPLELRKVPQPRRQLVRRQPQATATRMDQVRATAAFDTRSLVRNLAPPATGLLNPSLLAPGQLAGLQLPPTLSAATLPIARTAEQHIDLDLEMLDVNSMDTGRYRAMVIQDPKDRQSLKGFVKLSQVMSARAVSAGTVGWGSVNVRQVDALRDAVNEYTGLQADFIGSISYDDERLLEVPVIIPQGIPNESEMAQLARY